MLIKPPYRLSLKTIILLVFVTLMTFSLQAQDDLEPENFNKTSQVLPPAPNAASLGKYGGVDFNMSNGMISVPLPLYELRSSSLSVPVSLSYSSSGFKVDEIASRVGTGWSLNAGGVITRTVYGGVDEKSIPVSAPADLNDAEMITFMKKFGNVGPFQNVNDAQRDIFSFNVGNLSGKFVLDTIKNPDGSYNRQPILLSHSGIKIERNIDPNVDFTFRITNTEGIQYYFHSAVDYTTSSGGGGGGCGYPYDIAVPTAWYLSKIIHPNNDTITFQYSRVTYTYATHLSQTVYHIFWGYDHADYCFNASAPPPPTFPNSVCKTNLQTEGALLKEIQSSSGGKVKFNYITRDDYSDSLVLSIEVYQPGSTTPWKIFDLSYVHSLSTNYTNAYVTESERRRPFLSEVVERDPGNILKKSHKFLYNTIHELPPRLSFSQDHWGYFNGKWNSGLLPVPEDPEWALQFSSSATANRNPDPNYAQMGLLCKVSYPTGGWDTVIYEGNQAYDWVTVYPTNQQVSLSISNTSTMGQEVTSPLFTVSFSQQVTVTGQANSTYTTDPALRYALVELRESDNTVIRSFTASHNSYFSEQMNLAPGTYKLVLKTFIYGTGANASLTYKAGTVMQQYMNVPVGGVRVAKIVTSAGIGSAPITKRYFYRKLSDTTKSSGITKSRTVYEKVHKHYYYCGDYGSSEAQVSPTEVPYYSMYSNSLFNLNIFSLTPVSYTHVSESFGENFEQGGIEREFIVRMNNIGTTLVGDWITGTPTTSNDWINGKLLSEFIFKKNGTSLIPVQRVSHHYKNDLAISPATISGYLVTKKFNYQFQPFENIAFNCTMYSIPRNWLYVDSISSVTYNLAGTDSIASWTAIKYEKLLHALPTSKSTNLSKGGIQTTYITYPTDMVYTGQQEIARQSLVSKHMIGFPLRQEIREKNVPVLTFKYEYGVFPNGLTLLRADSMQIGQHPMHAKRIFSAYTDKGKIAEQSRADDLVDGYIWNDLGTVPIANVVNAGLISQSAYTSFETDGNGSWTVSNDLRVSDAITGTKAYQLSNGAITKTGLITSASYVVSYWTTGGTALSIAGTQDQAVLAAIRGQWKCFRHQITGVSQVSISGSAVIDELRLYPANAQMKTYTYIPLVGISSECDVNNRIMYYEYDGFGRLQRILDQDYNILKTFEYKYHEQQ